MTITAEQLERMEKRWQQKLVAVRALSARLAKLEPDGPEIRRVSGDQPCSVCELPYREHPDHPFAPSFHVVCDGSVVKT